MKKILALLCVIGLLFVNVSAEIVFGDVDKNTESGKAIYKMAKNGIIEGYGNGFFGPGDTLTRAQAVKIINKIFGYKTPANMTFKDVSVDEWYYMDVSIAVNAGYVSGYGNGLFGPNDLLTKEHVCVMLDNIMKFIRIPGEIVVKDEISSWAKDSVEKIISNGLATTDANGKFHATEKISREEACVFLSQFVIENTNPGGVSGNGSTAGKSEAEQKANIQKVIKGIKEELIYKTDNAGIKEFFLTIAGKLEKYLADPTYDYKGDMENTQKQFRALKDPERREAKNLLINFFMDEEYASDVSELYDFFF